jgi:hypothetical protein
MHDEIFIDVPKHLRDRGPLPSGALFITLPTQGDQYMAPPDLGVDVEIVDELPPAIAPTQTDTCFLLHTAATGADLVDTTDITDLRDEYPAETGLLAHADAFFNEAGGGRVIFSKIDEDYGDLDIDGATARLTPEHGPGQLVAPEAVTANDLVALASYGWAKNRIALLNGPDGATSGALQALAAAVIASTGGRFAGLESDTIIIPGTASGQTREVSAAIIKAGLIARNDLAPPHNPNLAAAGSQGQCRYAIGIKAERTLDQIRSLAALQVNAFRIINSRIRAYGYLTLADLDEQAHWWDLSGSRTMMAARAREAAVAEEMLFGNITADGNFQLRYEGGLRGELSELQKVGALFGTANRPGYRVDVSDVVNPISQLATGQVKARITLKTSPHARALSASIIRRRIDQEA